MTLQEWWWVHDGHADMQKSTPDENGVSEMDWERARAAHKEKMNDRT